MDRQSDLLGTESRETNNLVLGLDTSNSKVVHDVVNLKVIEQNEVPDCGNNAKEIVHQIHVMSGSWLSPLPSQKNNAGTQS